RVSNEPGELGELETEMFALEKKQNHLSCVEKNLKEQLATAEFDTKVANERAEVKRLEDLERKLYDKITELRSRLKAEGKDSTVIISMSCVGMPFVKDPLGNLRPAKGNFQKKINYQRSVIEALEKKLG
ncbi:MAG: hypothetical protein JSS09_07960, partial [Verrucomicrobia bacterium]|nr:hypothetical protein [Verrucomicrobiota bacterium]